MGTHTTGLQGRLTRFRDIMAMWMVRITIAAQYSERLNGGQR